MQQDDQDTPRRGSIPLTLAVISTGCGTIAISSLTAHLSDGPLAFASGMGIGVCVAGALAGVVTLLANKP